MGSSANAQGDESLNGARIVVAQVSDALPEVVVEQREARRRRAARVRQARPQPRIVQARRVRPAPVRAPQPSPEELAQQQAEAEAQAQSAEQAAFAEAWRTTGNPRPNQTIGNLPPVYAGGQVAVGTRVGVLGNQSVFNTPFNITSFTEKLNRDQQSRAIIDVVTNDPSVQAGLPRGGHQDQFVIRGFRTFQQDILFDGLGGLVDFRRPAIDNIERVEVLKGQSALLHGVIFGGNVGGTINLIPERATDDPITRYTLGFVSKAEFGHYLDVGRRFGANKEWGIRVNGTHRDGQAAIDRSETEYGFGSVALDYRGERLRVTADAGAQRQEADPFITLSTVLPGFAIPRVPKLTTNWNQPWTFEDPELLFATTRAEFDVTDWLTIYGAYGLSEIESVRVVGGASIFNSAGDFTAQPTQDVFNDNRQTYDVGARANFRTGPLKHKLVVSAASLENDSNYFFAGPVTPRFTSNIYDPVFVPRPNIMNFKPVKAGLLENRTLAIADAISLFDERVILTLGVRQQELASTGFDFSAGPNRGQVTARYDEKAITPAVGFVVKPLERLSIYGNYIEGLQQGPTAPSTAINAGEVFPPFVIEQREIGAKYDFGVLGVGVSAFEIMRPSAFTDPVSNLFGVDGLQENRGVEVNLFGEPLPGFRVIGGVAFIDAELVETQGDLFNGNVAPGVPDAQISLYSEYDLPFGWARGVTLTGRMLYSDFQFYDRANTQTIPDWTRFDFGLRYTYERANGKPVVLRANVENVLGRDYWATAIDGLLSQGSPRTYLVSAQFDF